VRDRVRLITPPRALMIYPKACAEGRAHRAARRRRRRGRSRTSAPYSHFGRSLWIARATISLRVAARSTFRRTRSSAFAGIEVRSHRSAPSRARPTRWSPFRLPTPLARRRRSARRVAAVVRAVVRRSRHPADPALGRAARRDPRATTCDRWPRRPRLRFYPSCAGRTALRRARSARRQVRHGRRSPARRRRQPPYFLLWGRRSRAISRTPTSWRCGKVDPVPAVQEDHLGQPHDVRHCRAAGLYVAITVHAHQCWLAGTSLCGRKLQLAPRGGHGDALDRVAGRKITSSVCSGRNQWRSSSMLSARSSCRWRAGRERVVASSDFGIHDHRTSAAIDPSA